MPLLTYHFSVDDGFECLCVDSNRAMELPEFDYLEFFDRLHRQFDAVLDVYLFLEHKIGDRRCSLADINESRLQWFQNRPWLRFAPHAIDRDTPPYKQSAAQAQSFYESASQHIDRFAGPRRHSHLVRLHYFSECYEIASCLRAHGVEALLTTDKPAISYRLPMRNNEQLRQAGITEFAGIHFLRSHVRIENLVGRSLDDDQLNDELNALSAGASCAVILTHEYELVRPEVREMTCRVFSWVKRRQLKSISERDLRAKMFAIDLSGVFS